MCRGCAEGLNGGVVQRGEGSVTRDAPYAASASSSSRSSREARRRRCGWGRGQHHGGEGVVQGARLPSSLPRSHAPAHTHPRTHAPTLPRAHAPSHTRTHAPSHTRAHTPTHPHAHAPALPLLAGGAGGAGLSASSFRNAYLNLALPLLAISEPEPPATFHLPAAEDTSWSPGKTTGENTGGSAGGSTGGGTGEKGGAPAELWTEWTRVEVDAGEEITLAQASDPPQRYLFPAHHPPSLSFGQRQGTTR